MSPALPQQLWLLRHGESVGNVARDAAHAAGAERITIDAPRDMDVPLSPRGEEQAAAVGRWLGRLSPEDMPTVVLSSPYLRAQRTAEIALAQAGLGRLGPAIDERLRERELGVLDRLTQRGVERLFPEQAELRRTLGKFYHRPPGGESWCDVILRLRSLLGDVQQAHAGERVLLVCHSAVVLCLRYLLEGMSEQQILAVDGAHDVGNCSLTTYALQGPRLTLTRFNFVAPLQDEGAPTTTEPHDPLEKK